MSGDNLVVLCDNLWTTGQGRPALNVARHIEYDPVCHKSDLPGSPSRCPARSSQRRIGWPAGSIVPERVKELRRTVLEQLKDATPGAPGRQALYDDLDDVFLVVQLFSYPGNYVAESATIERIALA